MPSQGKGLNRFSGLTISEPPSAGPSAMETSVSRSDSGGGSAGTTGAPSTVQDTLCMAPPSHAVQGATEGGSVYGANARFTVIDTDATMASIPQPFQLSAHQIAHLPFLPHLPVLKATSLFLYILHHLSVLSSPPPQLQVIPT